MAAGLAPYEPQRDATSFRLAQGPTAAFPELHEIERRYPDNPRQLRLHASMLFRTQRLPEELEVFSEDLEVDPLALDLYYLGLATTLPPPEFLEST